MKNKTSKSSSYKRICKGIYKTESNTYRVRLMVNKERLSIIVNSIRKAKEVYNSWISLYK